jgi:ankyrin repeat protein
MASELIEAIEAGKTERVRELVRDHPEAAEDRSDAGVSALMLARYHFDLEAVDAIRAVRTDLDVFEAATLGDVDRLRELLDADPSLANAWSPDKGNPLHFAAFFAQPDAAGLLLERGAEPNAVAGSFGHVQPLHSAAAGRSAEIVAMLLDAGADPNARQDGGFTPIHAAAQNGDRPMAEDLLARGADPTLTTDDGRSAADFAREKGHEELAALLSRQG